MGSFLNEGMSSSSPPYMLNLGDDIYLAPMLCVSNFDMWKHKMQVFLTSQDFRMWRIVKDASIKDQIAEGASLDENAKNWILSGLDDKMRLRVPKFDQAMELWDFLEKEYGELSSTNTLEIQGEAEVLQTFENDGKNSSLFDWQSMHDELSANLNILCMNNIASLKILDEISHKLKVLQKCVNRISSSCVSKEDYLKEDEDYECDSLFSSEHASISSFDDSSDDISMSEECAMLCLNDDLDAQDDGSKDYTLLDHVVATCVKNETCIHDDAFNDHTVLDHVDTCCVSNDCDTFVENDDIRRHVHNSHDSPKCPPHMPKCISCYYCGKNGHMLFECPTKRKLLKGAKAIWIVKGSSTNSHGPKKIWVPKSSID